MKPILIVISAPSGAGKTTLCDRLLQDYPELNYSISCTTRKPRGEEEDGVDYHFMELDNFKRLQKNGEFLEFANVHGCMYGTLKAPVYEAFAEGQGVLMDIDVAGAAQVRAYVAGLPKDDLLRAGFVDIFILPPSMEVLEDRLRGRGEDSDEVIETRLRNASREMAEAGKFRHRVLNDDLEIAYKELCAIVNEYSSGDHYQPKH